MQPKDLYAVLGIARTATADEIRKAYRKLARETHPDVKPNDPKAEERFKEVSFAYEVLSDPEKRARYDEFGVEGLAEGFDPNQARAWQRWQRSAERSPGFESHASNIDLDDLLGGWFGGRATAGPRRGADAEAEVTVDLLDAALGGEVSLELAGRGPLRVRIPAGSDEGTRVRLAGQGMPGRDGGPAGDLYLGIHVRPHPLYRREGSDLHLEVPVTLSELVVGATIDIPTPDGVANAKVPPRSPNGRTLRLRGKGARRRDGSRGDLYAKLVVALPETDDPKLASLAHEIDALHAGRNVREKILEKR
jgi:DnaJ-class molecular chaperone